MKKAISIALVLAMCLSLCACGKSEAVKKVEEQISAIGEVSLDSKTAIDSAQQAFDSLTEDEKAKVENYFQLVESQTALKELEELEEQRLIEEQEKAKFVIGKETYDNMYLFSRPNKAELIWLKCRIFEGYQNISFWSCG